MGDPTQNAHTALLAVSAPLVGAEIAGYLIVPVLVTLAASAAYCFWRFVRRGKC